MINFQGVKVRVANMDYGFHNPASLFVIVPIVSLIFQRIQVSCLNTALERKLSSSHNPAPIQDINSIPEYQKIITLYKWHAMGSLIQTIALLSLYTLYPPLFLVPVIASIYELNKSFFGMFGATELSMKQGQWRVKI